MTPEERYLARVKGAQAAQSNAIAQARAAVPKSIFSLFSNSGIRDQVGGTAPLGGWNDRDISPAADAMARDVSRADVVPFGKSEPLPRNPRPPSQQPMRPAALAVRRLSADDLRKLSRKQLAAHLTHNIAARMAGAR
jgi:hypothetical protein